MKEQAGSGLTAELRWILTVACQRWDPSATADGTDLMPPITRDCENRGTLPQTASRCRV